jgi:hypothetical protein
MLLCDAISKPIAFPHCGFSVARHLVTRQLGVVALAREEGRASKPTTIGCDNMWDRRQLIASLSMVSAIAVCGRQVNAQPMGTMPGMAPGTMTPQACIESCGRTHGMCLETEHYCLEKAARTSCRHIWRCWPTAPRCARRPPTLCFGVRRSMALSASPVRSFAMPARKNARHSRVMSRCYSAPAPAAIALSIVGI